MIRYAAKLEHGAGVAPETVDEDVQGLSQDFSKGGGGVGGYTGSYSGNFLFSRLKGKKRTALAVKTLRDMRQTKRRTSKS